MSPVAEGRLRQGLRIVHGTKHHGSPMGPDNCFSEALG